MSVKAHEGFKEKIEESFSRQTAMRLIGAELAAVEPGKVVIRMPYRADLCQQNGFVHAGIISTIADSAGGAARPRSETARPLTRRARAGYAGFTMFEPQYDVLSAEFKINLLRPATGDVFEAEGEAIKAGRRLTVTRMRVFALRHGDDSRKLVAEGMQTLAVVEKPGQDQQG